MLDYRIIKTFLLSALLTFLAVQATRSQVATVSQETRLMPTYNYGDPDPVASPGRIYPYFRFDGFSLTATDRKWDFVKLENDWINVWITPSIGGKIYGAQEKGSANYFIYFNNAVKFRDIALRGAWTSGGIEMNFGTIGHAPTTATPVDYFTRENSDGSVSCFLGALDLTSRSEWRVEVRLPAQNAWFETKAAWFNMSDLGTSLYHWMNASADIGDDLRYFFPGNRYIDHSGTPFSWPETQEGRDLSLYRNNDYGSNHSYHILGNYSDWFAGYYMDNDFGFGHWSRNAAKAGKKIWIWSLAREGSIWENLLADTLLGNRQYTEFQTGLLFNQANSQSTFSPFRHVDFKPGDEQHFSEIWFPIRSTSGVAAATPEAVANFIRRGDSVRIILCSLSKLNDTLDIRNGSKTISFPVSLNPMEIFNVNLQILPGWVAGLRNGELKIESDNSDSYLNRPVESVGFDWESTYGLYSLGQDLLNQRDYKGAYKWLTMCIEKDSLYIPAYTAMAQIYIHKLEYDKAGDALKRVLSVNTYDPEANWLWGLLNDRLGNDNEARIAYGIALLKPETRTRSLNRLMLLSLREQNIKETAYWLENYEAYTGTRLIDRVKLVSFRLSGRDSLFSDLADRMIKSDPLNHFTRFEKYLMSGKEADKELFKKYITNEFPYQTYIELATWYLDAGLLTDAGRLLELAPDNALVDYYRAYINAGLGRNEKAEDFLKSASGRSPRFIFPFRHETEKILRWAAAKQPGWKIDYYLSLLYWSLDRYHEADSYFSSIGNQPEKYYIYLARGDFYLETNSLEAEKNYREALNVGKSEWRVYDRLVKFYLTQGYGSRALELSRDAFDRFQENYIIGIDHVRSLMDNDQFHEAVNVMKGLNILPFEGASEGRKLWRDANILSSLDKYWEGDYQAAREYMDNAYQWPENLGVGKPFNWSDVLLDFINAGLCVKEHRSDSADSLYSYVAGQELVHGSGESLNILTVFALREMNRTEEADSLFNEWIDSTSDIHLQNWAKALYNGEFETASQIAAQPPEQPHGQPWERITVFDELGTLNRVIMQYLREKW